MEMKVLKRRFGLFFVNQLAWFVLIMFYAGFATIKPHAFLNFEIPVFLVYSSVHLGLLVLAESVALFTGNFDLSIESQVALIGMASGVILMHLPKESILSNVLGIILPILIGLALGLINGTFVGLCELNPFLVTLGTFMAYRGASLLIRPQSIWARELVPSFIAAGADPTITVAWFAVLLIVLGIFFKYTKLGNYIYAVGGDPETCKMMGVSPRKITFIAYGIVGILCGLATLAYAGFNKGVPINVALGATFPAFAGAVIGGVSLSGGRGSLINAFAGALLVGTLEGGLTMFNVSPDARKVAFGMLVIAAIVIDRFRERIRDAMLRPV